MNFRRLKYFVKIVDIGSLTQAAEVLHIAQPALSQQLATLEGELQQQLLIRSKRGVIPTEAGNILYAHAQTILRMCEQTQAAVSNIGLAASGQVALGVASGCAAAQLAMPLLQAMRDAHPGILLRLHEDTGPALTEQVASCALDMAVIYGTKAPQGFNTTVLAKEDLYLVASRSVPNPGDYIDLRVLAQLNLFLPHRGDSVRDQIEDAMAVRKLTLNVVGEIESPTMLSAAIAGGLGATILPESAARALTGPARAWMARISNPSLALPLALCVSVQQPLSEAAQAVKAQLLTMITAPSQPKRALTLVQ